MPARQTISLLVILSALIALPVGIATAGDIDVEGSTSRVTIDDDGGITIRRSPTYRTTYPSRYPSSRRQTRQYNLEQRLRSLRYPRTTQNLCNGRRVVRNSTVRSGSNSGNSTYSSTTTTTCQ
ncbi:hypothetical protein SAMD00079811_08410 [Scytonema sp. HK-05]|uniref:hypothetical protein n=1 Tax=Scytonema sp. HK-05 TaxID=1137095 RepID=UPI000937C390|nr:hypothetical protein [Scytonema sp. HK-05]OKH59555.1 hypothetical protein NIES2130_08330 [Scytonema sp. HK-05]BAY43262.1 hypothetical protein SAMD00079811_08410 [Scytonema sp. HK-05]